MRKRARFNWSARLARRRDLVLGRRGRGGFAGRNRHSCAEPTSFYFVPRNTHRRRYHRPLLVAHSHRSSVFLRRPGLECSMYYVVFTFVIGVTRPALLLAARCVHTGTPRSARLFRCVCVCVPSSWNRQMEFSLSRLTAAVFNRITTLFTITLCIIRVFVCTVRTYVPYYNMQCARCIISVVKPRATNTTPPPSPPTNNELFRCCFFFPPMIFFI